MQDSDRIRSSQVIKHLSVQIPKNELLKRWSLFKPVLDRYIELAVEILLSGYAVEIPNFGKLQIVKKQVSKLPTKQIIISRIGFKYIIQVVTDMGDSITLKEDAALRKQLRHILTTTTKEYRSYEHQ